MAELERLANHFGDIGAICNDAGFAIMLAIAASCASASCAPRKRVSASADDGLHCAGRCWL